MRAEPGARVHVGSSVDKGLNNWRYELEPSGTGTDVTESFRLKDILPLGVLGLLGWAAEDEPRGMRATLERMKAELGRAALITGP